MAKSRPGELRMDEIMRHLVYHTLQGIIHLSGLQMVPDFLLNDSDPQNYKIVACSHVLGVLWEVFGAYCGSYPPANYIPSFNGS